MDNLEVGQEVELNLKNSDGSGKGKILLMGVVSAINADSTVSVDLRLGGKTTTLQNYDTSRLKIPVEKDISEVESSVAEEGLTGGAQHGDGQQDVFGEKA